MTSLSPETSVLSVLATVVADASPLQSDDEVRSNGVVDTPARENEMKTEDQPSSSRPSRKAKEQARKNLRSHAFAESFGEPERRIMRFSIKKPATPARKNRTPSARKSSRRGPERRNSLLETLENVEQNSTPYRAEEPVSERAEVEATDIRLRSPESTPKVTLVASDSPKPQVPSVRYQHQADSSKTPEDAAVKPHSPDEQVTIVDNQQQHTRYELSGAVKVSAAAVDDHQQNERSELSDDAAIETASYPLFPHSMTPSGAIADSSPGGEQLVTSLKSTDVLFGRGSGPSDHKGNALFRSLVRERKSEYMATNHRQTKANIALEIVDAVLAKNGRFLMKVKPEEAEKSGIPKGVDAWTPVDEKTIMEKTKQVLRQKAENGQGDSPYSPPFKAASVSTVENKSASMSPESQDRYAHETLDVLVPAVDNRQQDHSRESAEDAAAEQCYLCASVPDVNDQRQDESPESTEDAVIESPSPFAQVHLMNGRVTGYARAGMYTQTRTKFSCPTQPPSSITANGVDRASFNPRPQQRQETSLKATVSDDYVSTEHVETNETEFAARKMSVFQAAKSPDQAPQFMSPPLNQYYVEETAWKKFNPPPVTEGEAIPGAVASEYLQPLPPALPIPKLPHTGKCMWSFDEDSRVLLAEFVQEDGTVEIVYEDEEFLLRMMERDDITVISDGLATGLDPKKWTLEYIANAVGDEYYHKFRAFKKEGVKPERARTKRKQAPSTAAAEHVADQSAENVATGPLKKCRADRPLINGLCTEANEPKQANGSDDIVKELSERFYTVKYLELDVCMSMKVYDFVRYMGMRKAVLRRIHAAQSGSVDLEAGSFSEEETIFKFVDHMGKEQTVDVTGVVLYMIDFDVVKLLPKLYEEFVKQFELSGCLPGGIHCMMNSVNINGRPFMGPNLYCTPPESFTQCHQDGHGTVDSGHLCLAGFNEVVMIRRLPQRHKLHALALLKGEDTELRYDGLYDLPHGDGLGEKPGWPCLDAIENCRRMNYYPSTFILRPGQLVHINKGRLHMFRKLSPSALPTTDCHAKLRSQLLATCNFEYPDSFFCFSIAWDWMYRGVTSEGIYREVMATLECTILNRLHNRESLAIPELSLLQMARTLTPVENVQSLNASSLLGFPVNKSKVDHGRFMPSSKDILRGILPALRYVVDQHTAAVDRAVSRRQARASNEPRVSLSQRPNTHENPQAFALDPYGSGDFFCKLCSKELSNVYMHCDGCEILLSKDFNICVECWDSRRYKRFIQMHPLNGKRHSTINHTGNYHQDRASRCPCHNGPICLHCEFCAGCSCKCHQWFTLHRRFFMSEDEKSLVRRVEAVVGENQIPYSEEVFHRLEAASKPVASSSCDQAPAQGAKRPAMEYLNESRASKKPKDDKTKSNGPVARLRTSRCRDQSRDPPDADPQEAPPKPVKKKVARNTVPHILADSDTVDVDFDPRQRPNDLRPAVCAATHPVSRDDLSDGALASTEPRGNFRLPKKRKGGAIRGFSHEEVRNFVEEARALDVRTPSSIRKMFPDSCKFSEDDVRHLFRNFADCSEIGGRTMGAYSLTFYSRRELDILLYARYKDLEWRFCHALMPYRDHKNIECMARETQSWVHDFPNCVSYIQHLENTVGLLLSLEFCDVRRDELGKTEVSAEPIEDRTNDELGMTEVSAAPAANRKF